MKLCTCEKCHYTFLYPLIPSSCPDCGFRAIRPATEKERVDYQKNQKILAEEIRQGIYAAVG